MESKYQVAEVDSGIYCFFYYGNTTTNFVKYNSLTKQITTITDPNLPYESSKLVKSSTGEIFGAGSNQIFQYIPATDSFLTRKSVTPHNIYDLHYELVENNNGSFYGLSEGGGLYSGGVLYEYFPNNDSIMVHHHFPNHLSFDPFHTGGLCKASNGKYYGTYKKHTTPETAFFYEFNPATNTVSVLDTFEGYITFSNIVEVKPGILAGNIRKQFIHEFFYYDIVNDTYTFLDSTMVNKSGPYGIFYRDGDSIFYVGNYSLEVLNVADTTMHNVIPFGTAKYGSHPNASILYAKNHKLYVTTSQGTNTNTVGTILEINKTTADVHVVYESDSIRTITANMVEDDNGNLWLSNEFRSPMVSINPNTGTIEKYKEMSSITNFGTYFIVYPQYVKGNDGNMYGFGKAFGEARLYKYDVLSDTFQHVSTTNQFMSTFMFDTKIYNRPNGNFILSGNSLILEYDFATDSFYTLSDTLSGNLVTNNDTIYYGITNTGGANGFGYIFSFNYLDHTFQELFHFDSLSGFSVKGHLQFSSNGKLYGLAEKGGLFNLGTIFEMDVETNTFTKKIDFNGLNGAKPKYTSLTFVSDSGLYNGLVTKNIKQQILTVYPNPFTEHFEVHLPQNTTESTVIKLYNVLGKEEKAVDVEFISRRKLRLNASELERGMYLLEVQGIGRVKIMKE